MLSHLLLQLFTKFTDSRDLLPAVYKTTAEPFSRVVYCLSRNVPPRRLNHTHNSCRQVSSHLSGGNTARKYSFTHLRARATFRACFWSGKRGQQLRVFLSAEQVFTVFTWSMERVLPEHGYDMCLVCMSTSGVLWRLSICSHCAMCSLFARWRT